MIDCIFCKIIAGEVPSYKIYEDADFYCFLDISQFVEGHTLVVPKQHFTYIWDVPNIAEYFKVVQKVGQHFLKDLGYKYVDTMTFGRIVPHAHVHVLPHNGDNAEWDAALSKLGDFTQDQKRRLTKEKGEILAKKFQF